MSFNPGDVVVIKSSGAPRMVVESIAQDGTVTCTWMNVSGTQKLPKYTKMTDTFNPVVLATPPPRRAFTVARFTKPY